MAASSKHMCCTFGLLASARRAVSTWAAFEDDAFPEAGMAVYRAGRTSRICCLAVAFYRLNVQPLREGRTSRLRRLRFGQCDSREKNLRLICGIVAGLKKHIPALDGLRGFAAMAVVQGHLGLENMPAPVQECFRGPGLFPRLWRHASCNGVKLGFRQRSSDQTFF